MRPIKFRQQCVKLRQTRPRGATARYARIYPRNVYQLLLSPRCILLRRDRSVRPLAIYTTIIHSPWTRYIWNKRNRSLSRAPLISKRIVASSSGSRFNDAKKRPRGETRLEGENSGSAVCANKTWQSHISLSLSLSAEISRNLLNRLVNAARDRPAPRDAGFLQPPVSPQHIYRYWNLMGTGFTLPDYVYIYIWRV